MTQATERSYPECHAFARTSRPTTKRRTVIDGEQIARKAREALENKHGENIQVFDVRETSAITDFTVVCAGSSPPHLKALFGSVQRALKEHGVPCYRKSGAPDSGWLVLDYVDAVIHIMDRQSRDFYAIEDLWSQAPQLD